MVNHREHRKSLFDDITALFRDIRCELGGLMDADSTAKQRRAIAVTQKKTTDFEKDVIDPLKKKMED